jgi:hypothetical protein
LQSVELRGFGYRYFWEKIGEKRSISANALSHVWYSEIAKQKGDETRMQIRRYCKLHFGIPIILGSQKEKFKKFRNLYIKYIKSAASYEDKLDFMEDLNVTSLFDKEEMKEYLDTMQIEYGKQGIILQSKHEIDYDCREANEG